MVTGTSFAMRGVAAMVTRWSSIPRGGSISMMSSAIRFRCVAWCIAGGGVPGVMMWCWVWCRWCRGGSSVESSWRRFRRWRFGRIACNWSRRSTGRDPAGNRQNSGGKLRPTSKLGKKTKRASQPNSPATDSSDIPLRLQTLMNYRRGPFEFALLTSTRLAKDKTPRGSWPRVGHQNASVPNRVETTKFNASVLLYCWHSEGQGRCKGYELQVRIGILCGINPFSISSTDHPGSW